MAYYTLITRENSDSPWFPQFGDYDRETAIEEMQVSYWTRNRDPNCKVIKTKTARQSDINIAIAELNSKLAPSQTAKKYIFALGAKRIVVPAGDPGSARAQLNRMVKNGDSFMLLSIEGI